MRDMKSLNLTSKSVLTKRTTSLQTTLWNVLFGGYTCPSLVVTGYWVIAGTRDHGEGFHFPLSPWAPSPPRPAGSVLAPPPLASAGQDECSVTA